MAARAQRKRARQVYQGEPVAAASPAAQLRPDTHKTQKRRRQGGESGSGDHDDSKGAFRFRKGDMIRHYEILDQMGRGTFGRVLECKDVESGHRVAVKVVRAVRKYVSAAKVEADLLTDVNYCDPDDTSRCVRMLDHFEFGQHYCIVFEPLGPSLYDYLRRNKFKPLPLAYVQSFAEQLLLSVHFLHQMSLIHTDLKPENILLQKAGAFKQEVQVTSVRNRRPVTIPPTSRIRLIDFGGATYDHDHKASLINTRQYRSPEVILGKDWSYASDMWSVGCILMELYTGSLLFSTHDSHEHLALMERTVGTFPEVLAKRFPDRESGDDSSATAAGAAARFFDDSGRVARVTGPSEAESQRHIAAQRSLSELINSRDQIFLDLISQLLTLDPARRLDAEGALRHQFFRGNKKLKVTKPRLPPPSWGAAQAPAAGAAGAAVVAAPKTSAEVLSAMGADQASDLADSAAELLQRLQKGVLERHGGVRCRLAVQAGAAAAAVGKLLDLMQELGAAEGQARGGGGGRRAAQVGRPARRASRSGRPSREPAAFEAAERPAVQLIDDA